MAESGANCEEIISDQNSCEVIPTYPSHFDEQKNDQEVKEGSVFKSSKYLPNGKIRLDDNGLVTHSALNLEQGKDGLHQENLSSNCQCDRSHDCMENNGHRSKTNKSLDCQLTELASEFDALDFDHNSKEKALEKSKSDTDTEKDIVNDIEYVVYKSEVQMPDIMRLITKDLSEPYSIYTYRYFIHNWPKLCFLAMDGEKCVGAIVCKLDMHKKLVRRGYIAMLAIDSEYRRKKIGSHLVLKAIKAMIADECDEVVLETEITNQPALRLYENLGFVRDKRLFRYYLNGVDALRLKLWLR